MNKQEDKGILVEIKDGDYDPAELTVPKGAEVEFVNNDAELHSVTSESDGFDLELDPGKSEKVDFNTPGTYDYYCRYHPEMAGTIVVQEAAEDEEESE